MGEVKSMFGSVPQGEPVPEIVNTLEDLLERAKAGEIQALAYAASASAGNGFSTGWEGNCGTTHQLGAAVGYLFHRFYDRMGGL